MSLEASYAERAAPRGSARYLALLFAAPESKGALEAVFALEAQLHALTDPATEQSAAGIKLAWWGEEIRRLIERSAVHPISRTLLELPGADRVDFSPLAQAVAAAELELGGVPVERAVELAPHAARLRASGLNVVAQFDPEGLDPPLREAFSTFAQAEHLKEALLGYRRAARAGRVLFPVDELLQAGIDNEALAREVPSTSLAQYLGARRADAEASYERALAMLDSHPRPGQRHLAVLAGLGTRQLKGQAAGSFRSLWQAWRLARRASAPRRVQA